MNDSARKTLMTVVERAVRPLRASHSRKLRMREELLSHLGGIFEEEFSRCGDEQASVELARRRFGDPRELSQELQAAVPRRDRILFWTEKGDCQPGESLGDFAKRAVPFCVAWIGFFTTLWLPIVYLKGRSSEWVLRLHALAAVSLISFWMMIAMALLIEEMRRAFFAENSGRSWKQMILSCLLSLPLFPLIALTFSITLRIGE